MSKPIRMFQLIDTLRAARRGLTAQALAERLEVSRRTVYRDIARLQAMGVPIDGEAGVGYVLRPGFDLPPLNFTVQEVEALRVGLAMLPRTGDAGLQAAAETAAHKLKSCAPVQAGHPTPLDAPLAASGWHEIPPGVDPGDIRRAIRSARVLAIGYRSENGAQTEREILPLAMTYYVETQVLAAWCRLRDAIRHFRLDRIMSLQETGEDFAPKVANLRRTLANERTN